MKLKQRIQNKTTTLKYYISNLHKAKAYVKLLDAANEVQKFGEFACFCDYPKIVSNCSRFKQDYACESKVCPLAKINRAYIDAKKKFDDARVAHYHAETAMVCVRVKE